MESIKSSVSGAQSYQEVGAFWDTHDLGDTWDQTEPVDFDVEIGSTTNYYAIETALSTKLRSAARQRGISPETLLNLWVQQKVAETAPEGESEAA